MPCNPLTLVSPGTTTFNATVGVANTAPAQTLPVVAQSGGGGGVIPPSSTAKIFAPIEVSTGAIGSVSAVASISPALETQRSSQTLETFLLNSKNSFANSTLTLLSGSTTVGTGTGTAAGFYGGQYTAIAGLTATGSGDAPSPGLLDVTGTLTTTAAISPTDSLTLRVASTATPTLYFDLPLTEKGAAGWLDRPATSGATVNVRFNARMKTAFPANHYPIPLLENQDGVYGGEGERFPFVDGLIKGTGDQVHPRLFRFTHTAGRNLSLTVPATISGSPYSQTVKVRRNGGAWVNLFINGNSVPINETDTYEFAIAKLATSSTALSQDISLFISGLQPSEQHRNFATSKLLYRNDANGTHVPQIYTVGPAKTYPNIAAIQALLKAGDTVRLQRGVAHAGARITKGGAVGAPVVFEPDPADPISLGKPLIDHSVTGGIGPLYSGETGVSRMFYFDQLVNHVVFRNIKFQSVRSTPQTPDKKLALGTNGRGFLVEDCEFIDWDTAWLMGDSSGGNTVVRRNVFSNCGLMAEKNGHSCYQNQDSGAWPDDWLLFESNVVIEAHGQGLPTRGGKVIARANWFEMNQDIVNPLYFTNAGNGRGGQAIVSIGAGERYCPWNIHSNPFVAITNNVGVSGSDETAMIVVAGDPVGRVALHHVIVQHNSLLWRPKDAYKPVVTMARSPKVVEFSNNAVWHLDGTGSFQTDIIVGYLDVKEQIGIPASSFYNNAWLAQTEFDSYPALGSKINVAQNTKLTSSPYVSAVAPYNFTPAGMPAATTAFATGMWNIPAVATTPIVSDMPQLNGVVPYDLKKRPWSTRPNINVPLVPPADAASAPVLIGAL